MMPDILTGDLYVLGVAVSQTALQVGMVAGFALGGIVVAVLHAGGALSLDAATFAGVRRAGPVRRAAAPGRGPPRRRPRLRARRDRGRRTAGLRAAGAAHLSAVRLARDVLRRARWASPRRSRAACTPACPLAVTTGLIFAAGPFGTVLGAIAFSRFVPAPRRQAGSARWPWRPAACCCCWPSGPTWPACLAVLVVSGAVRVLPAGGQRRVRRRGSPRAPRPGLRSGQRRHAGLPGPVDRARGRPRRAASLARHWSSPSAAASEPP